MVNQDITTAKRRSYVTAMSYLNPLAEYWAERDFEFRRSEALHYIIVDVQT